MNTILEQYKDKINGTFSFLTESLSKGISYSFFLFLAVSSFFPAWMSF